MLYFSRHRMCFKSTKSNLIETGGCEMTSSCSNHARIMVESSAIVNHASCGFCHTSCCDFPWQVQYLVILEWHFSWKVQSLVMLERGSCSLW